MKLSKERAESVRQYLLQVYGLPQNMVVAQGYGETQPIAANNTPDGREKNRRVVFRVTQR
jgi:outer membrane protein OmpA-like peptidoglycan-associated protein